MGIYVGEDGDGSPVMLHCGDPIQYAKLDTSYWQSHKRLILAFQPHTYTRTAALFDDFVEVLMMPKARADQQNRCLRR